VADNFVLLVEGKDDEHVLYALLNHHDVPRVYRVKDKQGVENLLNTLEVELLASELKSLGIVVDADVDIARRWQSLSQIIRNAGYDNVPLAPDTHGTIITEGNRPTIGIWIMPDNTIPGMLENFISFLVPRNDALWPRVISCLDKIPEEERLFPPQHLIKAQMHTWLSWQREPGSPLGLAITRRYLEAGSPHALMLVTWIRRLFNVDV
jgi:hypothetical protein